MKTRKIHFGLVYAFPLFDMLLGMNTLYLIVKLSLKILWWEWGDSPRLKNKKRRTSKYIAAASFFQAKGLRGENVTWWFYSECTSCLMSSWRSLMLAFLFFFFDQFLKLSGFVMAFLADKSEAYAQCRRSSKNVNQLILHCFLVFFFLHTNLRTIPCFCFCFPGR